MLRASLLTMALSSSCLAFLGDWSVWTSSKDARMAVVSNGTAWVATGGGVMEWSLTGGSSRLHTRKTGLPTIDMASVVLDSAKTVWAIGTDGRIGYRAASSTEWQTIESYSSQNWVFAKRAAQFWKGPNHPGFLILGTDHGLTLFSLKSMAADDYASTFGTLTGSVQAVMVTPGTKTSSGKPNPDTLWVALKNGLVHATPDWDSVGTAGHFLADPSQWTVDSTVTKDIDLRKTLIRDANGVRLGINPAEWSNNTGTVSIANGFVRWKDKSLPVAGAVHAVQIGNDVLVSTSGQSAVYIPESGPFKTTVPEGNFPDIAPNGVRIGADGSLVAISENRILVHSTTRNWDADTIRVSKPSGLVTPDWSYPDSRNWRAIGLSIGPQGEMLVSSWGETNLGGAYFSSRKGQWDHLVSTPTDSCMGHSITVPEYGAAVLAIRSFANGTYLGALNHSFRGRILFREYGQTDPVCLEIPKENNGNAQTVVADLLPVGDTLWAATHTALVQIPSPKFGNPVVYASQSNFLKANNTGDVKVYRLARTTFEGKVWIVGAADGRLILFPADGTIGGRKTTSVAISDSSAPGLKQSYRTINVDAQGQIWAGGDKGIDIVTLVAPDADTAPPRFQPVRRITTADGLPDNFVWDMDLQVSTGRALIATGSPDGGSPSAVSLWTSPYRPIAARLAKSSVRVSPNPVRLRRAGEPDKYLYVDGATADSRFDLLAADGTLVMHLDASKMLGGQFQIPLPAPSKLRPGLYFWSLNDKHSSVRGPLLIAE